MKRLALLVATVFGCGYFPKGPGTVGSLAGLLIAALLGHYGFGRVELTVLTVAAFPIAVWASSRAALILGRKDPGQVVIDEVLGQWVTLLGAPVWNAKTLLAGFLLFRLFDIWKPQPVRLAESLPTGTGIVADDIVAGGYAALILYIGTYLGIV